MRQPSSTNYRPANRFRAKKGKKMQRETHRKCSRAGKPNRREEDILAGKGKRRAAWNKHIHVPRCFLLLVASQFALYLFYSPPCLSIVGNTTDPAALVPRILGRMAGDPEENPLGRVVGKRDNYGYCGDCRDCTYRNLQQIRMHPSVRNARCISARFSYRTRRRRN